MHLFYESEQLQITFQVLKRIVDLVRWSFNLMTMSYINAGFGMVTLKKAIKLVFAFNCGVICPHWSMLPYKVGINNSLFNWIIYAIVKMH